MKRLSYIKIVVRGLGVAAAAAVWAQSPSPITPLYGTTTLIAPNEFAVATTVPTLEKPRAQYVVVADANDNKDLEVLAWHDTTTSLESMSRHGLAEHQGVVSVAVTGLDASRVVTADINKKGVLSIDTWKVEPEELPHSGATARLRQLLLMMCRWQRSVATKWSQPMRRRRAI